MYSDSALYLAHQPVHPTHAPILTIKICPKLLLECAQLAGYWLDGKVQLVDIRLMTLELT